MPNLQHLALFNKAKTLGIQTTDVSHLFSSSTFILEHKGISELAQEGVPTSWVNARSRLYCDNKQLTKMAYDKLKLPYPKSITFKTVEDAQLTDFFQEGRSYVCKPLDGAQGLGVVMNIKTLDEVKIYYKNHKHLCSLFMLEEQIEGKDLRLQVIGGKIVAACIREPAFVLGNGIDNLQNLIEKRRIVMQTQNPHNVLEMDESSLQLLQKQQISLSDIPKEGQKVQLKYVSNMAQGGIATDITDEIHPVYHQWTKTLCKYLNTNYFALDFITGDYTKNPKECAWILEINAFADWLHHTFSERKTHDIAAIILQELFKIQ